MTTLKLELEGEQVDILVASELMWMHQHGDLEDFERAAYELVIRDYTNPIQWAAFKGVEIDE